MCNIGKATRQSGSAAGTIRYYKNVDLVRSERSAIGCRLFDEDCIRKLRLLQQVRALNFTQEKPRTLLPLYGDERRSSLDVKNIPRTKIGMIDRNLVDLKTLPTALRHLAVHAIGSTGQTARSLTNRRGETPDAAGGSASPLCHTFESLL